MFKIFQSISQIVRRLSTKPEPQFDWQMTELRKSSVYLDNTAPPSDKEFHLSKTPLYVLSVENQALRSPIKEFVLAYHPEGYLTSLIYPRLAVSWKLYSEFKGKGSHFIFFDRTPDSNPRLGFTKNLRISSERDDAKRFIQVMDNITPFSSTHWSILTTLLDANPDQFQKPEGVELDRDKNKPFFLSNNAVPFNGARVQYDDRYDRIIPADIPPIHQAILQADEPTVRDLLSRDPRLANQKDPAGIPAHSLAIRLGLLSILKACFDAREQENVMTGSMDFDQQIRYKRIMEAAEKDNILALPWLEQVREISYSMLVCLPKKVLDDPLSHFNSKRNQYIVSVTEAMKNSRPSCHQACIEGSLQRVQEELQRDPSLRDKPDPFGFTPILLAMANGHKHVTQFLIEQGASLKNYTLELQGGSWYFRPIDNARTPGVMELLLHHGVTLEQANSRLADAVRQNDYDMVKILLFYLRKLPVDKVGLTPFELAMKYAITGNMDIIKFFLKYWNQYVPDGPYDKKTFPETPNDLMVSEELEQLLVAHNQRIEARVKRKKVGKTCLDSPTLLADAQGIQTAIVLDGQSYQSTIKPADKITSEEMRQLESKPDVFYFLGGVKSRNQAEYFKTMLLPQKTEANRRSYVDIWTDEEGNITNFFAFDVEQIQDPDHGHLILFHGKLACSFSNIGITDLNFHRISYSLMTCHPQTQVYVFFRAIPPGYGMSYIPQGMPYYPKYHFPEDLVTKIFATKGISIDQRMVGTDVNAKQALTFLQLSQEYHRHITKGAPDKAVPVCYKLDTDTAASVLSRLSGYGVPSIESFAACWQSFAPIDMPEPKPSGVTPGL
jgi:ankyrin repeat protein